MHLIIIRPLVSCVQLESNKNDKLCLIVQILDVDLENKLGALQRQRMLQQTLRLLFFVFPAVCW